MNRFVLLLPLILLAGCIHTGTTNVLTVQNGDVVAVDYVGSLEDGTVFDTSVQAEAQRAALSQRPSYEPLQVTVGAGEVIPGFNNGVVSMKIGEQKTVSIPPEEAYGEVQPDLVVNISKSNIQGEAQVGAVITGGGRSGRIIDITNDNYVVDFNHELAGKTLVFKITLVNVTRPTS